MDWRFLSRDADEHRPPARTFRSIVSKDKLGTRKVPTAELTLERHAGATGPGDDRWRENIAPLLNITRLWNGISAVSLMRRSIALALDYAHKRRAFGAPLSEKPLHMDTLAGLQAETEAAFQLAFFVAELTGRRETNEIDEEQDSAPSPAYSR